MTPRSIPHQLIVPAATLRAKPDAMGEIASQLLFGELFDVERSEGLYSYGINRADGYPGWVETAALAHKVFQPTHRVVARSAFVYAAATMKQSPRFELGMGAGVAATGDAEQGYASVKLPDGRQGWIWRDCLSPVDAHERDPVAVAERLLGAPYLWGGRGGLGLDCSGLVQLAFALCGRAVPRDSGQQEATFASHALPDIAPLQRGDLLFFTGHVGFMADTTTLLHANAGSMDTRLEPLTDFTARTRSTARTIVRPPA